MKKVLILLMLLSGGAFLSLESCNKSTYTDATVVADGDGVTEGCGWLIYIDGLYYIPVGLRNEDYVDGKIITIQYTVSQIPQQCVDGAEHLVANITRFLK
jgi:hypothetical protein